MCKIQSDTSGFGGVTIFKSQVLTLSRGVVHSQIRILNPQKKSLDFLGFYGFFGFLQFFFGFIEFLRIFSNFFLVYEDFINENGSKH